MLVPMSRFGDSGGLKSCWEEDERYLYADLAPKIADNDDEAGGGDAEEEDGEDEHEPDLEPERENKPAAQQAVSELIGVIRRECKSLTEGFKKLPGAKAKELKGLISAHVLALGRAAKRAEKHGA